MATGVDRFVQYSPPANLGTLSGMGQTYTERRPAPALERHLSCVWVQRVAADSAPYAHRTVPNGGVEVSCLLGSAPRVIGPQSGPTEEVLAPGATVVGIRFRPGAAPAALGMPASEVLDLALDADELWGGWADALGERMASAASPEDAAALLEQEILARLRDAQAPDPVVAAGVQRLIRAHEVTSLTASLYISESQLRRRFRAATGFAPKAVHRMLRFQGFLALAGQHERPSEEIALLAAEAGYSDQSHLTREALRLAGQTPLVLLRESEHNCRGVHDHTASYAPLLPAR
jgi:AraC-like DNA-binding protein